jgi:hypothetical protein
MVWFYVISHYYFLAIELNVNENMILEKKMLMKISYLWVNERKVFLIFRFKERNSHTDVFAKVANRVAAIIF